LNPWSPVQGVEGFSGRMFDLGHDLIQFLLIERLGFCFYYFIRWWKSVGHELCPRGAFLAPP